MDPNLFHLDWERTFEVLAAIVVLAFLLERALAPFFENRLLLPIFEGRGVKEFIGLGLALVVCLRWHFDAVSTVILADKTSALGYAITAAVIAGGSKASVKLFRDVLGFKSTAYAEYESLRKRGESSAQAAREVGRGTAPPPPPAESRR